MRVLVIVKANEQSEAGVMPSTELLEAMGRYNEELVKAGIMLAGEGLHPSSKGVRVRFSGSERTVIDGPFVWSSFMTGVAFFVVGALKSRFGLATLDGRATLNAHLDVIDDLARRVLDTRADPGRTGGVSDHRPEGR